MRATAEILYGGVNALAVGSMTDSMEFVVVSSLELKRPLLPMLGFWQVLGLNTVAATRSWGNGCRQLSPSSEDFGTNSLALVDRDGAAGCANSPTELFKEDEHAFVVVVGENSCAVGFIAALLH